jgi:hypothetical protein
VYSIVSLVHFLSSFAVSILGLFLGNDDEAEQIQAAEPQAPSTLFGGSPSILFVNSLSSISVRVLELFHQNSDDAEQIQAVEYPIQSTTFDESPLPFESVLHQRSDVGIPNWSMLRSRYKSRGLNLLRKKSGSDSSTTCSPIIAHRFTLYSNQLLLYDKSFSDARVSIVQAAPDRWDSSSLTSTFSIILSIQVVKKARIGDATVKFKFLDGTILSLEPTSIAAAFTLVHHTNGTENQVGIHAGTGSGIPGQGTLMMRIKKKKGQNFKRGTCARLDGTGVGTRVATWVLDEDPGEAGRHGIPIVHGVQEFTIELDVRPSICYYEVQFTVVRGEGKKPTWWNSKRYSTGEQMVSLT